MAPHISSTKPIKKPRQKRLLGHWLTSMMMKAPENVTLLIDAIIFLQNNVSLSMLFHPPEDILIRNPALSLFRGILYVEKSYTV